jgi:hypothetical protein
MRTAMPARRQRLQAPASWAMLASSRAATIGLTSTLIVFGGGQECTRPPAARQSTRECATLAACR